MDVEDFEEAIHVAREITYRQSCNNGLQAIGIPYAQWNAMKIACDRLHVDVKHRLAGDISMPLSYKAPVDWAYTTVYLKKVHRFQLRILEGIDLEHWALDRVEESVPPSPAHSAPPAQSPVVSDSLGEVEQRLAAVSMAESDLQSATSEG